MAHESTNGLDHTPDGQHGAAPANTKPVGHNGVGGRRQGRDPYWRSDSRIAEEQLLITWEGPGGGSQRAAGNVDAEGPATSWRPSR